MCVANGAGGAGSSVVVCPVVREMPVGNAVALRALVVDEEIPSVREGDLSCSGEELAFVWDAVVEEELLARLDVACRHHPDLLFSWYLRG